MVWTQIQQTTRKKPQALGLLRVGFDLTQPTLWKKEPRFAQVTQKHLRQESHFAARCNEHRQVRRIQGDRLDES